MVRNLSAFALLCIFATGPVCADAAGGPIKVEVVKTDSGYQLLRGGKPYAVRGVGMSRDHIEALVASGGNSIRNWTTADEPQNIRQLLDKAHANGVTVMLCLPMQAERWGFDYDNADDVSAQLEAFREVVLEYRNHPALLAWIIGNELNHGYTNPRVYDAVNDVAEMIDELDPYHPTTTTVAAFRAPVVEEILARAPALDFISFQAYGELFVLPERVAASGFEHPFMVTEWGAIGYWEVEKTRWGAPIEGTSSQKADVFRRAYANILEPLEGPLLGSYAFYWGQKQERTPTWFGLLTETGEETEAVDVLHYIWNGSWPDNQSPRVKGLELDGRVPQASVTLRPGQRVDAVIDAYDPDGDALSFRWELKPESDATQVGGDFETSIANIEGFIDEQAGAAAGLTAPGPGAYRLFVYVYDGHGHAAHANFPFLVAGDDR
ncbi:MAG: glycoside hydrolase family 2 TIM barrel-domain containing protein [Thiohalocapsa sp.]|jgi:hypothetical protein